MISEWIKHRLPELIEEHGVVGAQVAVLHNGEIFDATAGVLNNVTGDPVTSDSIFQVGSITKVWTATLVQELVNEGLLDLDRPVRDVLPEFGLADEQAAQVITPRQLLCHTGGFEGDLVLEAGNGDDMLEKYVELMGEAKQETPPGELYTYCNSGFVVLGRIVEVVRGKPFNAVLRERLIDRLGLSTPATCPAEYAGHSVADGHLGTGLKPVTEPMAEVDAPAGSVLAMSARDLLEFVRLHLGTDEFDAMRETQVLPPDFGLGGRQGLGWMLHDYDNGMTGMGHTGRTLGFLSWLRVIPEAGFAITVLTNGGEALPVVTALYSKAMGELAGVRLPDLPKPPGIPVPVDVEKVAGVYRAAGLDVHVTASGQGGVKVRFVPRTKVYEALTDDDEREFTGLRDDALIAVERRDGFHSVLVLCGRDEQDRVKWVHYGRAAVRQPTTAEWIRQRLPELLEEHGVVGAQVAVLHNGDVVDAAAGVRDMATKEPVTTGTLFQIGSITKVWTATLIMQLVREGLLDLDRPVREVLPEFSVADEQAARVITPRQLLCHTAGFEGDLKFETGSGDDMLQRYVELLAVAGQATPPGELYSYCNAGYAVLGRIVEVLRGKPFRAVLRERLVEPLGLRRVAAARAEYARHEMADGYLKGEPVTEHLPESWVAGGSVLAMPARELLQFVRMHLETGEFDAMREKQATHPDFGTGEWWWGLGWELSNCEGGDVIGHTGMTMGYVAILRVVPAAGVAVAVMANGGDKPWSLFTPIVDHLLKELAGVSRRKFTDMPVDPEPVDHAEVVGLYRCSALDIHVTPADQGRVKVRLVGRDPISAALLSAEECEYVRLKDDMLIAVDGSGVLPLGGRDEHGRVGWVHWSRAAMRV